MKYVLAAFAVVASVVPCGATPVSSFRFAEILYCLGSFANGPCTLVTSSGGSPISGSGTVNTSGETATFSASSIDKAGSLGGKVSVDSTTLNSNGPGIMVDALEQLNDVMTVSFGNATGSGFMELRYTLEGTNTATGADLGRTFGPHGVPYACVKLGVGQPIFPFGCTAFDQPVVNGLFSAGVVPFTYGEAFNLWFQLESIAGTGFGAGRPTGAGTSNADFFNTAQIAGIVFYDQNMNVIRDIPTITSALDIQYADLSAVPEPATLLLAGTGIVGFLARRRRSRARAQSKD